MTPQERETAKKAFLDAFKEIGYKNKACAKLGIERTTVSYWSKTDPKFALDYQILQEYWKDERKEILDTMLFDAAKTPRGFMHMMAWFRSNGFEEYNPKSTVKKESPKTEEALKKLTEKLDKYGKGDNSGKGKS